MSKQCNIIYRLSVLSSIKHSIYALLCRSCSPNRSSSVTFCGSAPALRRASRFSISHRASSAVASCAMHSSSDERSCLVSLLDRPSAASSKSCNDILEASSKKSSDGMAGSRIDDLRVRRRIQYDVLRHPLVPSELTENISTLRLITVAIAMFVGVWAMLVLVMSL